MSKLATLRKTCKHTYAPSGIYVICHVASGRVYIGSSACIRCRWNQHKWNLKRNTHRNEYLQKAWNKYGEGAFLLTVLEECSIDVLVEREQYWMDVAQCTNDKFGFNLAPVAQSQRGMRYSKEICEKMRQLRINPSEHTRELLRQANLGRRRSAEDRKNISEHSAKRRLTREQVIEIQERYEASNHLVKQTDIAKEYGVSGHTISSVVRRAHPRYQTEVPFSGESTRKMSGAAALSAEGRKRLAKNFASNGEQIGERASNAKLTNEQVRSIRIEHKRGTARSVLAKQYNVTSNTIHDIVSYKSWSHVDLDLREVVSNE